MASISEDFGGLDTDVLAQLNSAESRSLLDTIDNLRELQSRKHHQLASDPIVVGDRKRFHDVSYPLFRSPFHLALESGDNLQSQENTIIIPRIAAGNGDTKPSILQNHLARVPFSRPSLGCDFPVHEEVRTRFASTCSEWIDPLLAYSSPSRRHSYIFWSSKPTLHALLARLGENWVTNEIS